MDPINLKPRREAPPAGCVDRVFAMDEEFGRERNWTNVDIEIFAARYFLSYWLNIIIALHHEIA